MHRRVFLQRTSIMLAAVTLPGVLAFSEEPTAYGRLILPINRGWRYHPSKVAGAESPKFDDALFEEVVIPHTNISPPWHSFDDKYHEFISTYRRRFRTPRESKGKRVFVDFQGVMTASTVWIIGVPLGEYKGGFTPFSFELTPHPREDGENVLTVQVNSTERSDIPPFGYEIDYMTIGGIYREISVTVEWNCSRSSLVHDPEGNRVEFTQQGRRFPSPPPAALAHRLSTHIMHAGSVVHDRASLNHLYKDELGFHFYCQGAPKREMWTGS